MIHVIATVELVEGARENYLAELRKIIADVRAEKGCIDYGPTGDIETGIPVQEKTGPDTVTIIERWTDVWALKDHLGAAHMKTYREATKSMVKRVGVRILEPL
jgi:quinol monooxygenase YgiN